MAEAISLFDQLLKNKPITRFFVELTQRIFGWVHPFQGIPAHPLYTQKPLLILRVVSSKKKRAFIYWLQKRANHSHVILTLVHPKKGEKHYSYGPRKKIKFDAFEGWFGPFKLAAPPIWDWHIGKVICESGNPQDRSRVYVLNDEGCLDAAHEAVGAHKKTSVFYQVTAFSQHNCASFTFEPMRAAGLHVPLLWRTLQPYPHEMSRCIEKGAKSKKPDPLVHDISARVTVETFQASQARLCLPNFMRIVPVATRASMIRGRSISSHAALAT